VHCEFTQLKGDDGGTIARIAARNPNLSNVPARDGELAPLIRSIFLPDDGETWQCDDFSQIEYRLLAHFAVGRGSDEIRQRYNTNPKTDYHKLCAEWCGIDPEDKPRRKAVKGINFSKTYGARPPKLALLINCSLREAEDFFALYEEKLPFTVATADKAQQWAAKQGFVSTILGRRQRFSLWEPMNNYGDNKRPPLRRADALAAYGSRIQLYKAYAALNRKLQGSNADIMKKTMVDAWEAGICKVLGPYLITIYDELDTTVPQTMAGGEAAAELTHLMENAVTLKVPVVVETARGENWGECL
jgi:DNA polymerase-1